MRQILQNMSSGETSLIKVPVPQQGKTDVLIRSSCSLISIGTERMMVEFGKANMLSKARQQPEKVKMVLEKVKTDGLATYNALFDGKKGPLSPENGYYFDLTSGY